MPSELQRLNHLETFIAEYQVNWANLTPSVAALLDPGMTPELKTLLLTSEPMSLKGLATWEGKVNLLFAYGQAESVSLCCVRRSPTVASDRKNVGHRVGRSIWLVDTGDHNKLVPVGAVGELVIQGPVLARGYLDAERTALAFLHDVAWLRKLQPGYDGELYKTGDLAQFADDGSVRYLGRKDNSVKLYGQRLDLDDVLQQVQRCLIDISDTEVCDVIMDVCRTSISEDVKLTAFLGMNPTSLDTGGTVLLGPLDRATVYLQIFRTRLASVVPRYMIPTVVVIVSHIPLNLSGKTDRRKLREILFQMTASEEAACLGSVASHEAPCTPQELQLRSLWSQVLNTAESSIGRFEDFFRRGGDSLAAMRLASAAHGLGLSLTFGDIFANPVLSSQAKLIGSTEGNTQQSYTCSAFELITESQKQAVLATAAKEYALPATQIEDIYPTTPMQQGLVALNSLRPGSYVSRRVYKLREGVSFRKLEAAWKATLDANPALRTRVIRSVGDGPTYQVVVRDEAVVDMAYDLTKYLADDEAKPVNLAAILKTQVSDTYHGHVPVLQTFREFVKYVLQSNKNSSDHWRMFGLTVSGRAAPVPGIDKIAGPTIATFPLRVQLRSSSSIHEELETLQKRIIEMIQFEQFGVQNISRLGDDAAKACKFQSLLVIQQRQSSAEKSGIFGDTGAFTPQPMWNTYALTILSTPGADRCVRFEAVYDATVVPKAQMRRILQVFGNVLKQTVLSPDKLVGDMDSISTDDLQQIECWNSSAPPAVPRCIHDMIHDHCVAQPEASAIDAWDGQFTYKQLDDQSSLFSAVLREKRLGPDMMVPLCFEKSKWVAVAILAVAKAGSAFILLDPSHPTERLAWICKNAQASVLLCSKDMAALAAKLGCQHVVQVDENSSRENQASLTTQVHHPIQALPSNALCALYTSGSTGTPKGVVIEHSAFATQVTALGLHFHLGRQSRIFQFASHAFDVTAADYVFGLALGGCVCVPNEADSRDNLAKAIRDRRANWTFLTPSVARTLTPSAVPDLNTLVIGGESAKGIDFTVWSGAVRLVYVYGPAEGTVYCTVQPKTQPGANPVNIGSAASSACWLVEPANPEKLVAIGAVGELVIEGPIVGRGYMGEDLGGSPFIPPPKWLRAMPRSESPGRLYRTGDLMRYSPDGDGSLEFVGRKDRQVKLRGQRMELAEIEHQVARHFPATTDAIVEIIAPENSDSQRLLAAFIWDASNVAGKRSSNNQGTLSTSAMFAVPDEEFQSRASIAEVALRKSLPPFMIPSLFVPLKQFPLGPTGKVDRRLIKDKACSLLRRELNIYRGFCSSRMRPPSNTSESKIHQLVADVLGRDRGDIGMNDDFFQLGGDSISAMVLSARAMDMDLKLSAADILGHPRLCDMADLAIQKSTERCLPTEQLSLPEPFSLLPANYHHNTLMQEVVKGR
ncbi:Amino acid adenylation [Cordyceps fumosorosea ARSEF 2679]|uniref:Amino acid adenylation n=1 Tax=Cordyceps fumosorosea (strain ARSEF 2679) TaxID=1081104 RepID=A0A167R1F2_CORFA|nr:Amino acid adenylation [Cordyceps fumosorosea ARSEF 2679]OAA58180.1 Amino acid adenylation [Cordyceps fumosorosea ARSEF 2679]